MKPLELHIYERHTGTDGSSGPVYRVGGSFTPYAIVAKDKRFSEAELAAQYWATEVDAWRMVGYRPEFYNVDRAQRLEDETIILRRFATLPHASDNDYE